MGEIENSCKHIGKKPHAIVFPLIAQGHINPCVRLAIKLASKGLTITFVHFEHVHHRISRSNPNNSQEVPNEVDIFSEARESGLNIHYTTINDGFPLDYDRVLNSDKYWDFLIRDFPAIVDKFVGKIIESSDPSLVHFLVADTFFSWPTVVANKYNLVYVSFWTEPAAVFALTYYMDILGKNGQSSPTGNQEKIITHIPGIESISTKDIASYIYEAEATTVYKIVVSAFKEVQKADFILCNTVQELEANTVSALNQNLRPTYAIGPINFTTDFHETNVSKSMLSEVDCTEWLNSMPRGSVLYISFGSVVQIGEELMKEIAHGILLSEVNFIWVVRPDVVSSIDLPFEFKGDAKDKGLIVPWCDQKAVLSNSAVGGFLTHCGWNSIVESMWCGVPMICHPVTYDQPTNRKLVVDDWNIGVNLCDGTHVTREETAEKINRLMRGETSDGIRREIKKVSSMMHNAWADDGSSNRNFDQFLNDLREKIHAKSEEPIAISDV